MGMSLAVSAANAMANAIAALVDAGSGPGTVKIYSGAKPATVATAPTGTLLCTVVLGDPAFAAASGGVITGADPAPQNPTAAGTAGWFRAADSAGTAVYDGTVSATGGGGDMQLSNTSLASGISVDITALSVTIPLS